MSGYRVLLSRGFTLVELMVTIAVLAVMLAIAVPSFQEFTRRNRVVAASNSLVSALALARSEAIKRAARVTVASANWTGGWQVFVDAGTVGDASGDTVLRVYQPNASNAPVVTADANFSSYISYLPSGESQGNGGSGAGSFQICNGGVARVVSIINTGRVSTSSGTC